MKSQTRSAPFVLMMLMLVVACLGWMGCKSTPKVDWESRIGHFTYDQAVTELGPPDKTATLSDGKKVVDWVQPGRGGGMSFGVGTGFSTGGVGVGVGQSTGTRRSARVLRLTFGQDDKLVSFSKNY